MKQKKQKNQPFRGIKWAQFRFSVIGGLLSSPPESGRLKHEVRLLSQKIWRHPINGNEFQIGASTIERWFYHARQEESHNPINDLENKLRKDRGRFKQTSQQVIMKIEEFYKKWPYWSYQLLFDNLTVWALKQKPIIAIPSYTTICRLCKTKGWIRQKNIVRRDDGSPLPSSLDAQSHRQNIEIRSYEHEFVGGLWHLDFHVGTKKILLNEGNWVTPMLLSVIDDASRLVCHAQWYLNQTTESLIHALSQAFQKRGLPRSIMSDNGSAMISGEFTEGLSRLSIINSHTLPYSPYQNAKKERFWGTLEGRFMNMIHDVQGLTLNQLNDWTQIWVEIDYNKRVHSELNQTPAERFLYNKNVLREAPETEILKQAFTYEEKRIQRRTDGTIRISKIRFEVPSAYRHHTTIWVRIASWDLSYVYLCHPENRRPVAKLYPLDKIKNSTGNRRHHSTIASDQLEKKPIIIEDLPPLLQKFIQDYNVSGLPPIYIRQEFNNNQITKKNDNDEITNKDDKNELT